MKKKLPTISFSSLTDFISCKQRYFHHKVEGLCIKYPHLPEPIKLARAWDVYTRHLYDDTDYQEKFNLLAHYHPAGHAKILALKRAHQDLEIQTDMKGLLGCRYRIHTPIGQNMITGHVDRAHEDHIVVIKLSTRPDFYQQRENLAYQVGTYFMGNEAWQWADVEITRLPTLRTGYGKYSDERPEGYQERIYGDILSRPSYYFVGWDKKTRTYGVRFYRSEFDLNEIFRTYAHVLREIKDTCTRGSWYPNNLSCHVPTPCVFLPIKRSGVVSDEIYNRKEVRQSEG
jgi:hypothetical protein